MGKQWSNGIVPAVQGIGSGRFDYSPTLFSSITVVDFVSFTPIGFVRGVSRYVKEDLVDSNGIGCCVDL